MLLAPSLLKKKVGEREGGRVGGGEGLMEKKKKKNVLLEVLWMLGCKNV